MKVIFLDYDGVLNNWGTTTKTIDGILTMADKQLVARLNLIIERTGAKLVLSSSWRLFPDWERAMELSGIKEKFLGRTGKDHDLRGEEIDAWLNDHPEVTKYAIIDDCNDMLPSQLPNFFQTSSEFGLTQEIADSVKKHLQS